MCVCVTYHEEGEPAEVQAAHVGLGEGPDADAAQLVVLRDGHRLLLGLDLMVRDRWTRVSERRVFGRGSYACVHVEVQVWEPW